MFEQSFIEAERNRDGFFVEKGTRRCNASFFYGKDVMAILPAGFGKSLIFQLLVMMCGVRNKRQGGIGFSSIIVISPLQSIIQDQVVEVNSMGMMACDVNEKLNCLNEIHQGKFNIIYTSAEATMENRFLDSLKSKDSLFDENMAACIVDESHTVETWTGLR